MSVLCVGVLVRVVVVVVVAGCVNVGVDALAVVW